MQYGFIGAGRMATAMAGGLVASGLAPAQAIIASDPLPEGRQRFANALPGAKVTESNIEVAAAADLVVLAVKPQRMAAALASIQEVLRPETLVVSVAAGVTLSQLESELPTSARVIRVMPNTPSLVGWGASGYSLGHHATPEDAVTIQQMLESMGLAVEVPEELLHAVTGVSGSGPAFIYTVIEAMSDGGVRAGLPREIATRLAAQTVAGAARMVLETGSHPAELRDAVASPGGTTIAGLAALEQQGGRAAILAAVEATVRRSQELAPPNP